MKTTSTVDLQAYARALGLAVNALRFYADPENYHAISFMADRPAGGFADDFDKKHGHEFYNRAMPGKHARAALKQLEKRYGTLTIIERD